MVGNPEVGCIATDSKAAEVEAESGIEIDLECFGVVVVIVRRKAAAVAVDTVAVEQVLVARLACSESCRPDSAAPEVVEADSKTDSMRSKLDLRSVTLEVQMTV